MAWDKGKTWQRQQRTRKQAQGESPADPPPKKPKRTLWGIPVAWVLVVGALLVVVGALGVLIARSIF
jgi:hypothetical protein